MVITNVKLTENVRHSARIHLEISSLIPIVRIVIKQRLAVEQRHFVCMVLLRSTYTQVFKLGYMYLARYVISHMH